MVRSERVKQIGRGQLDRRLGKVRSMGGSLQPPAGGWLASVRKALGMTQADLARRMGVSQQAVSQLERREMEGAITLEALRQAAEALGSTVVYAVVPRQPIEATLEERAYSIARRMVASVRHSMRLEDQETESDADARIREVAAELLASPGALWSHPDAG